MPYLLRLWMYLIRTFYQWGAWTAAKKLHHKLVRGVFRAPISWFDVTPVGRIVNRFAKDISSLDMRLLMWLQYVIDSALQIIFRIGAVTSVMPVFIVPAVVVAAVGYVLGEVYVRANIAVKRCLSITESPLFSHFGDTILGAVTIRAYGSSRSECANCSFGAQNRFAKNNLDKIDTNLRPYIYLYLINRWINIRADMIGSLMALHCSNPRTEKPRYQPRSCGIQFGECKRFRPNNLVPCPNVERT